MTTGLLKRLSLLGLVLIGVSALVAFIIPSKQKNRNNNALAADTGGLSNDVTCINVSGNQCEDYTVTKGRTNGRSGSTGKNPDGTLTDTNGENTGYLTTIVE